MKRLPLVFLLIGTWACNNNGKAEISGDSVEKQMERVMDSAKQKGDRLLDTLNRKYEELKDSLRKDSVR